MKWPILVYMLILKCLNKLEDLINFKRFTLNKNQILN